MSEPLRLFNSLTRRVETFAPIHPGEARVYSCGPTVYSDQHIGNMRAYLFADVLGRTLSQTGYKLTHVINITDVGHLQSDADEGEDKMEAAARAESASAWDVAARHTAAFLADIDRLNIRAPARWAVATDHIDDMIAFAGAIEDRCYRLDDGLYFDTARVPDYGRLSGTAPDEREGRIAAVEGKHRPEDFAVWRSFAPDDRRQMEWDSPWGRGAPGWHLECSAMSRKYLGSPFDIHTGGIDHREIHHPNEIAQNQARSDCATTGANIWMHNNFLVNRAAKMSKSSGDVLTLQRLVDRGLHPLGFRLMCLQAHYRGELEWSWDGALAALTRLKRLAIAMEGLRAAAAAEPLGGALPAAATERLDRFATAVRDDLNTPRALVELEEALADTRLSAAMRLGLAATMDEVLGLRLGGLDRGDLRVRPIGAGLTEEAVERALARRAVARAGRDYAEADRARDELTAGGVHVMDGDPLGWDWALG